MENCYSDAYTICMVNACDYGHKIEIQANMYWHCSIEIDELKMTIDAKENTCGAVYLCERVIVYRVEHRNWKKGKNAAMTTNHNNNRPSERK